MDGQKVFNKLNMVLALCGRKPLLDATPRGQFERNPVAAFEISNDDGEIRFKLKVRARPAEDIMVFASPPCSAGREYCSIFSFLGLLPAGPGAERDITKQYLKKLKE